MAIIKKFRIKSFKQKKPILKLENISLSFGNILLNGNFKVSNKTIKVIKLNIMTKIYLKTFPKFNTSFF